MKLKHVISYQISQRKNKQSHIYSDLNNTKKKDHFQPGTETARIEMGFGRLRLNLGNRKETEFGGKEIDDERVVCKGRREVQRVVLLIAENAIAENLSSFSFCVYIFVNERI